MALAINTYDDDDHDDGPRCPSCGLVSEQENPKTYECPRCGRQGFDCCVGGNNCLCVECETE